MKYEIREIKKEEYGLLEDFIYEAIYIPEGMSKPSKDIILIPELQVYIENFGNRKDDYGLVVTINQEVVGALWARIMNDYGHIDDKTPSLALAIQEPYRGKGIGTALLKEMIKNLQEKGYSSVSLSVQKSNPAFRLYNRIGFETIGEVMGETEEEIIMRYCL
ncbi:GNAT family N-acetyltransferase [Anaerosporobacter sp.]